MEIYKAVFEEDMELGVYGISLVESPASERNFISLNKQKNKVLLTSVDNEKRMLIGVVLEPNTLIYRRDEEKEYYLTFDEDTINKMAHDFMRKGVQFSTVEHDDNKIEGIAFVESWVKIDEQDKSTKLGIDCGIGSWLVQMKINNDEIWNNYIKTKKVKGFSIDAFLKLEKVDNLKLTKIKKMDKISDMIKKLVGLSKAQKLNLGKIKLKDDDIMLTFEGDMLTVGATVMVSAGEGENAPVPAGVYELENDMVITVGEAGEVLEIKEPAPAPAPTELSMIKDLINVELTNVIKQLNDKQIEFNEKITLSLENITKQQKDMSEELQKIGKEPATKMRAHAVTKLNAQGEFLETIRGLKQIK